MTKLKKRTAWGDPVDGQDFERLFCETFGTRFGSRKLGLAVLGLDRRLFNMYIKGQRRIPDAVWAKLANTPLHGPKSAPAARLNRLKATQQPVGRSKAPVALFLDDIDPLS